MIRKLRLRVSLLPLSVFVMFLLQRFHCAEHYRYTIAARINGTSLIASVKLFTIYLWRRSHSTIKSSIDWVMQMSFLSSLIWKRMKLWKRGCWLLTTASINNNYRHCYNLYLQNTCLKWYPSICRTRPLLLAWMSLGGDTYSVISVHLHVDGVIKYIKTKH